MIAAAATTGCEAVHPGYGFLAENPAFVEACADNDLVFIGPSPTVMGRLGDKAQAKAEMRAAGVPLVPGTEGAASLAEARAAAREIGFPVLLKAAAGGGGKGMRLVADPDELDDAYAAAAAEAEAAFGDGSIYVERAVSPTRHVEIQVLCDAAGGVLTLGERECSIQRRHQKLIEESPSCALTPETREAMEAAVERACRQVGLRQRGDVRVHPRPGRRAVLHRGQLPAPGRAPGHRARDGHRHRAGADPRSRRASRSRVTGRAPRAGHAIEIRINAEDPRAGLRARSRHGDAVPAAARARGPGRHRTSRRGDDTAVLRLADREGDRPRRDAAGGDRTHAARARGAGGRGHPDDEGARPRRAPLGRVREAASTRPATLPTWKTGSRRSSSA